MIRALLRWLAEKALIPLPGHPNDPLPHELEEGIE